MARAKQSVRVFKNKILDKKKKKIHTFGRRKVVSVSVRQTCKVKAIGTDRERRMADVLHRPPDARGKNPQLALSPVATARGIFRINSQTNTQQSHSQHVVTVGKNAMIRPNVPARKLWLRQECANTNLFCKRYSSSQSPTYEFIGIVSSIGRA